MTTALPAAASPRTLTIVSNRSAAGAQLEQLVLRAKLQLSAKAYVHHYERHGVTAADIAERLELLQHVVDDYEGMLNSVAPSRQLEQTHLRD